MDNATKYIVEVKEQETGIIVHVIEGHTDIINSAQFSPDGNMIITGSDDKTVKIWKVSDFSLFKTLDHNSKVFRVSYSDSGKCIITTFFDGSVIWCDANTFERIPENYLDKERPYSQESPDKKYILEVPLTTQIP